MTVYSGTSQVALGLPYSASSATPLNKVGQLVYGHDNSEYVYVRAAEAISAGQLTQFPAQISALQNLAVANTAVGATSITTTSTVTLTKDQLADGFIVVTTGAGIGYRYQIETNPAVTGAAVTLTLQDSITVALDSTSRIDLYVDPWEGLIVAPVTGSATSSTAGFAAGNIAAGEYGWVQILGVGIVKNDANATINPGAALSRSTTVAGSVRSFVAASAIVARAITSISASECGLAIITSM